MPEWIVAVVAVALVAPLAVWQYVARAFSRCPLCRERHGAIRRRTR